MLLNALFSPEMQQETSVYADRGAVVTGTFLYCVAIMAVVIFVAAVVASMRVSATPPK